MQKERGMEAVCTGSPNVAGKQSNRVLKINLMVSSHVHKKTMSMIEGVQESKRRAREGSMGREHASVDNVIVFLKLRVRTFCQRGPLYIFIQHMNFFKDFILARLKHDMFYISSFNSILIHFTSTQLAQGQINLKRSYRVNSTLFTLLVVAECVQDSIFTIRDVQNLIMLWDQTQMYKLFKEIVNTSHDYLIYMHQDQW